MIKPIKTRDQYDDYLARSYKLMQMNLVLNSKEADELEMLSILIEAYENKHFPVEPPNPIEAILFRMDQSGMDRDELKTILGPGVNVNNVLTGETKLSLEMIRKLHTHLGISAQTLIKEYESAL